MLEDSTTGASGVREITAFVLQALFQLTEPGPERAHVHALAEMVERMARIRPDASRSGSRVARPLSKG